MTAYKRILFSIIIASISLFLANRVVSIGLKKYYVHKYQRLDELFQKNTYYDIVFIGSSRTHTSINPRIIDSITGLSTYNAGVEGGNLLEFKMTLDGFLVNHPAPRKIILTLDASSFNMENKFYNHTLYLPFLNNKVIDTTLSRNGHWTLPFKILPFIVLTEIDDYSKKNAFSGLGGKNELDGEKFEYKGYLSNTNKCIDSSLDKVYTQKKVKIDQEAISKLYSIIQTCKTRQIDLIIAYAPEYDYRFQRYVQNFSEFISMVERITTTNNLLFYRDDRLEICKEKCLFANYGHLNTIGAFEYSVILGRRLRDSLP